jgi:hypothetical protein
MHLVAGKFVTQALAAAAELNLAEQLTEGPKTAQKISEAMGVRAPPLYRLTRALAAVDVRTTMQQVECQEDFAAQRPGPRQRTLRMQIIVSDQNRLLMYCSCASRFDSAPIPARVDHFFLVRFLAKPKSAFILGIRGRTDVRNPGGVTSAFQQFHHERAVGGVFLGPHKGFSCLAGCGA